MKRTRPSSRASIAASRAPSALSAVSHSIDVDEVVQLDRVDPVDAEPVEGAADLLARAAVGALPGLRRDEERAGVAPQPRRDAQLGVAVARGDVDVVDRRARAARRARGRRRPWRRCPAPRRRRSPGWSRARSRRTAPARSWPAPRACVHRVVRLDAAPRRTPPTPAASAPGVGRSGADVLRAAQQRAQLGQAAREAHRRPGPAPARCPARPPRPGRPAPAARRRRR